MTRKHKLKDTTLLTGTVSYCLESRGPDRPSHHPSHGPYDGGPDRCETRIDGAGERLSLSPLGVRQGACLDGTLSFSSLFLFFPFPLRPVDGIG